MARQDRLKERRVFKFCFRADRVRSLKREVTLFRLLKERIGEHRNIVRLYDVFFDQPPYYVVMEYVAGGDLKTWSQERGGVGAIPMETRLEIVAQAADGLQAAHDAGVIHRDIKPGNILVEREKGERTGSLANVSGSSSLSPFSPLPSLQGVKLTDFGIGQVVSQEALAGMTKAGFTQTMMASGTSSQTGTQMYMAPELIAGKPATTRSDIYSLGVVLYQLVVGDLARPLTTDWAGEITDPLLTEDLKRCFAGHPEQRFAGAGQLAEHLRSLGKRRAARAEQQAALEATARGAYRRGLIRAASLAAVIVALVTGLALLAWNQRARAKGRSRSEPPALRGEHELGPASLGAEQ
jgi:serine/threonine protein kinase